MFAPRYRKILVLGSGFSKSFSHRLPIISDLSEGFFAEEGPAYPRLRAFAQRYFRLAEKDAEFQDFENLGTVIFNKSLYRSFSEQIEYLHLQNEYLKYVYDAIFPFGVDDENREVYGDFLRRCSAPKEARGAGEAREWLIITFNYDLMMEKAVKAMSESLPSRPGGKLEIDYGVELNRYFRRPEPEENEGGIIDCLKLHGSFNWFRARGSQANDISQIYRVERDDPEFSIHAGDVPSFIPMSHAKSDFLQGTLYNTLWAMAGNYFEKAEEIFFLGYSFPKTDLNNLIYFLDFKDKVRSIVVKEDAGSGKMKRLRRIFGESVVRNQDAREYIAEEFLQNRPA